MKKNIREYLEFLIKNRHVSSDMHDGVAVYFVEDPDDEIQAMFFSEYSHIEDKTIFCNYTITINDIVVAETAAPINQKSSNPDVSAIRKLLTMCSNKIIRQEILAQQNAFLRAIKDQNTRN